MITRLVAFAAKRQASSTGPATVMELVGRSCSLGYEMASSSSRCYSSTFGFRSFSVTGAGKKANSADVDQPPKSTRGKGGQKPGLKGQPWIQARLNDKITSPLLQVVMQSSSSTQDEASSTCSVMSLQDALAAARAAGLDLVETSCKTDPPSALITSFSKWKFTQQKMADEKDKIARETAKLKSPKECSFSIKTAPHDMTIKLNRVRAWLEEGRIVSLGVDFRHQEQSKEAAAALNRVIGTLTDVAVADKPTAQGNAVTCIIKPKVKA